MVIKSNEDLLKALENGHIDVDGMSIEDLDETFEFLNGQMMIIYDFILTYNEYFNRRHDYTGNEQLTSLEAHLLTDICDYPKSTVTSLATAWNRSVSATSQTIRKLIEKGLVTRKNSEKDKKIFHLYATKRGKEISDNHKRYDVLDIIKTVKTLKRNVTLDEIETSMKVLAEYTKLLHK